MIFKKIKYLYQKRNKYLFPYLQDIISEKTGFTPYKIKILIVSKENSNFFNYFKFSYEGLIYILKNNELNIIDFEN